MLYLSLAADVYKFSKKGEEKLEKSPIHHIGTSITFDLPSKTPLHL